MLGHEFAATVIESASSLWRPGQRVTGNPLITCGRCDWCLQGRDNLCANRTMVGMTRPGAFAAELAGMHVQTLRTYDRLGLVTPQRSSGGGRRYSERDVELLREVQRLSQDEGVNLAGIKRIIELTNQVEALQSRLTEVTAELERVRKPSTALVLWEPRTRGRQSR